MRNCFVRFCDAFCKKNGIKKRMMFSAPKANIDVWKKRLFNKRDFRETDRVCERHFEPDDIITHWDHIIDGKVLKLERDKPKLRPFAVPYLNLPKIEPEDIQKKPTPKKQKPHAVPAQKKAVNSEESKDPSREVQEIKIDLDVGTEQTLMTENRVEQKRQLFDAVYDDVYEIVLPSTLWGIHRDPIDRQYIVFTKFDINRMTCSRAVSINNDFEMNVVIDGVHQNKRILNEVSVEIITNHLNQLDE